jgi:ABC-2 type transport system permease protein
MTGQLLITLPTATAEFIPASESLAGLLGTFPIIWSTFIIIVCSGAVASESGVIADSILSKSVTRYEYILAKFSGRLILVLGLYLIVAIPGGLLLASNADNDMTNAGAVWGIVSVGMMLLLLTSLSVGLSTLFNRTLVALMVVWFLWYVSSGLFALIQLDFMSPLHIVDTLSATLRGEYETGDQVRIVGIFGLLSVVTISGAIAYFARKDL